MKKILSLLMLLVTIVSGAQAVATVDDLKTISASHSVAFADIMGGVKLDNGTLYDSDYLLSVGGNNYADNKGTSSSLGKLNCCRVKSETQDRIAFKVSGACTLNIYGETRNDRLPVLSTDGSATAAYEPTHADGADVMTFNITEAGTYYIVGSGDRFLAGLEFVFAAVGPTITTQPQNAEYVIGSTTYPSMSVEATASAGELSYQWELSNDGENFKEMDVTSAVTSTLLGSEAIGLLPEQAATYYLRCKVTDSNGSVYTEVATLTVTATAPVGPAVPTFDKAAGSTIKVGEPVVITSDDGSQIYYNWSGKATGAYDEAALLGRTPKDSPASCTTSTTGSRYLYALAKKGEATSDIAIIGYTVEANPVKGQLDKTSDNVDKDAAAPAIPVFSVVDADGNPSPASIAYGTATDKDVTVSYALDATSTSGIVTLKTDGSGIEAISTATAGTAIVNISLTSNKNGYPLIEGEGSYTYTITVAGGEPAPSTGPTITTQPEDVTYVVGSTTCGNMSVVAEPATEGDALTYQWQYSLNGEAFNDIPALYVPSATTSTLIGNEAIALINNLDPKPEKVYIKCVVSEIGATDAISDVATVTLQAPASYSESVNIEQLVLDNGVKYDIANEFVKKYIEYASLDALDSLNDAEGKFQRNEPFLGLKLKTEGAYIKVTLKQGSTLKVKLGNIGDNIKVNINGTEQEDIVKMTTKDEGYMTTVYEYTAADADAVVTFTTSSKGTVVFKQIMIDEDIAQVILPYAVDMPEAAANGTVEMPASANPGDLVTIVATPDEGYELDAITVTGKSTNNAYEVSADNKFTMPEENVNVTVTFKQITGINGIAEDAADAENANVKVIKNGKLYIGKYNIAGQLVK